MAGGSQAAIDNMKRLILATAREQDGIIGQRIAIHAGKSLDFKMDGDERPMGHAGRNR